MTESCQLFFAKSSILDVRLGSEYASAIRFSKYAIKGTVLSQHKRLLNRHLIKA